MVPGEEDDAKIVKKLKKLKLGNWETNAFFAAELHTHKLADKEMEVKLNGELRNRCLAAELKRVVSSIGLSHSLRSRHMHDTTKNGCTRMYFCPLIQMETIMPMVRFFFCS